MNTLDRVYEGKLRGNCCSENIMSMSLEDMEWPMEERANLIRAMGAFCGGLREGLACGALCAANSVLWLAEENDDKAKEELCPEMMAWFKERFGSWDCDEILEGDRSPEHRADVCPKLVADTYIKLRDMLEDVGAIG